MFIQKCANLSYFTTNIIYNFLSLIIQFQVRGPSTPSKSMWRTLDMFIAQYVCICYDLHTIIINYQLPLVVYITSYLDVFPQVFTVQHKNSHDAILQGKFMSGPILMVSLVLFQTILYFLLMYALNLSYWYVWLTSLNDFIACAV